MSFNNSINLNSQFALMQNKKRTGRTVLFHQILTLHNFTKLEFLQQHLFQISLFYQGREGEVAFQAFQNDSLIIYTFFLRNIQKILINLVVIDCSQCASFFRFSFSLNYLFKMFLTTCILYLQTQEGTKETIVLSLCLFHLRIIIMNVKQKKIKLFAYHISYLNTKARQIIQNLKMVQNVVNYRIIKNDRQFFNFMKQKQSIELMVWQLNDGFTDKKSIIYNRSILNFQIIIKKMKQQQLFILFFLFLAALASNNTATTAVEKLGSSTIINSINNASLEIPSNNKPNAIKGPTLNSPPIVEEKKLLQASNTIKQQNKETNQDSQENANVNSSALNKPRQENSQKMHQQANKILDKKQQSKQKQEQVEIDLKPQEKTISKQEKLKQQAIQEKKERQHLNKIAKDSQKEQIQHITTVNKLPQSSQLEKKIPKRQQMPTQLKQQQEIGIQEKGGKEEKEDIDDQKKDTIDKRQGIKDQVKQTNEMQQVRPKQTQTLQTPKQAIKIPRKQQNKNEATQLQKEIKVISLEQDEQQSDEAQQQVEQTKKQKSASIEPKNTSPKIKPQQKTKGSQENNLRDTKEATVKQQVPQSSQIQKPIQKQVTTEPKKQEKKQIKPQFIQKKLQSIKEGKIHQIIQDIEVEPIKQKKQSPKDTKKEVKSQNQQKQQPKSSEKKQQIDTYKKEQAINDKNLQKQQVQQKQVAKVQQKIIKEQKNQNDKKQSSKIVQIHNKQQNLQSLLKQVKQQKKISEKAKIKIIQHLQKQIKYKDQTAQQKQVKTTQVKNLKTDSTPQQQVSSQQIMDTQTVIVIIILTFIISIPIVREIKSKGNIIQPSPSKQNLPKQTDQNLQISQSQMDNQMGQPLDQQQR